MSHFNRRINLDHMERLGDESLLWLTDLFSFWSPAGSGPREGARAALRLAIRDDYLNFYRSGQSIAKVAMGDRAFHAKVHCKYLEPDRKAHKALGQDYVRFDAETRPDTRQGRVADWMSRAELWVKPEKSFVERIVGANPNVIDLEMALPMIEGLSRSAVRVDLVALEPVADGWQLVFWEAKTAKNHEARAKGEPAVFRQQQKYSDWLEYDKNESIVIKAYRGVCHQLVKLHQLVGRSRAGAGLSPLGNGIVAVSEGADLGVDRRIRLIIDNTGDNESPSFEANGHREKLERHGLMVQVRNNGDSLDLHRRK